MRRGRKEWGRKGEGYIQQGLHTIHNARKTVFEELQNSGGEETTAPSVSIWAMVAASVEVTVDGTETVDIFLFL